MIFISLVVFNEIAVFKLDIFNREPLVKLYKNIL